MGLSIVDYFYKDPIVRNPFQSPKIREFISLLLASQSVSPSDMEHHVPHFIEAIHFFT
jgi:hypothetical protein